MRTAQERRSNPSGCRVYREIWMEFTIRVSSAISIADVSIRMSPSGGT
jgi:hypothetical protein